MRMTKKDWIPAFARMTNKRIPENSFPISLQCYLLLSSSVILEFPSRESTFPITNRLDSILLEKDKTVLTLLLILIQFSSPETLR